VKREDRAEKSNFANKTVENKNFKKTNPKFQKTNPKDDEEQVNKKKNNKQKL
jgi:hypothetical protein